MESSRMNFPAEEFAHTVTHLAGGGHRVGEGEDFLWLRVALLGETRDAVNQDRSFSGTGPRNDQHWTVNVLDGFALAIVWEEWSGRRLKFGDSHWGSEYHQVQNRAEHKGCEKSRGQDGSHNGQRGYSGGLGAENCVSERSGNPSGLLKGLELVVGPSAFGADGESNSVTGGLRVQNIAEKSSLFRFGEDNA